MNKNQLIEYLYSQNIDPNMIFIGEEQEFWFTDECNLSKEEQESVIEEIGDIELMGSQERKITDRVSEVSSFCFFKKHNLYIEEVVKMLHREPQEWNYFEVEPQNSKSFVRKD